MLLVQEAAQNIDQAVEIEVQIQQMSNLTYLLHAGGLPFLVIGLIMGIVGLILVLKPRRTSTIAIFAFVSLLPGAEYANATLMMQFSIFPRPTLRVGARRCTAV